MQTEHRIGGMKEPQTYTEFGEWLLEGDPTDENEAAQWAYHNRKKYTDLRIADLQKLPRDYYTKLLKEGNDSALVDHLKGEMKLFHNDCADEHSPLSGHPETERYWDAFCGYFKIKRATFYKAKTRVAESNLEEVMRDGSGASEEDMRRAYKAVAQAEREYNFARDYKGLKKKHQNAAVARVIFDYYMNEIFEQRPLEYKGKPLEDYKKVRAAAITYVGQRLRKFNKSKAPARPVVVKWLEGYRDDPLIDAYAPEDQDEVRAKLKVQKPR